MVGKCLLTLIAYVELNVNVVLGDGGGVEANKNKKNPPKLLLKMIQQTILLSRGKMRVISPWI